MLRVHGRTRAWFSDKGGTLDTPAMATPVSPSAILDCALHIYQCTNPYTRHERSARDINMRMHIIIIRLGLPQLASVDCREGSRIRINLHAVSSPRRSRTRVR